MKRSTNGCLRALSSSESLPLASTCASCAHAHNVVVSESGGALRGKYGDKNDSGGGLTPGNVAPGLLRPSSVAVTSP